MTHRPACTVRGCTRPPKWLLHATHHNAHGTIDGARGYTTCGVHLDGLSTKLEHEVGVPSVRAYSAAPVAAGPAQGALFGGGRVTRNPLPAQGNPARNPIESDNTEPPGASTPERSLTRQSDATEGRLQ